MKREVSLLPDHSEGGGFGDPEEGLLARLDSDEQRIVETFGRIRA